MLYSLVVRAKQNGLDVEEYLTDLLQINRFFHID